MGNGRVTGVFRALLGLGVMLLVLAACGDGAEPTPATATPDGMLTPEPSPAVTATATAPPAPAIVVDDPALHPFGEGALILALDPGASQGVDGLELAGLYGGAPPCAGFALLLSWQVQSPWPPPEGGVVVTATRMDMAEELGRGPAGTASTGCAFVEVTNPGGTLVTVEVRYVVAEYRPE